MRLEGRVAIVTGGASGIGRALCRRFADEGARVAVADRDQGGAEAVAREIHGLAVRVDVGVEAEVRGMVDRVAGELGPVDLCCANAGIAVCGGEEVPDAEWDRVWRVNLMAQVYAARAVLPAMLARGEGYFLSTASAAGLLNQVGAAPYAVTKHAAVAFAEWLSLTYGDRGIRVSCLCPLGVRTPMLLGGEFPGTALLLPEAIEPEAVADAAVRGIAEERFLILPQPQVREYLRRKVDDPERWLKGMRRLQQRLEAERST